MMQHSSCSQGSGKFLKPSKIIVSRFLVQKADILSRKRVPSLTNYQTT